MPGIFITSVGTGIGKTLVTAALALQLRARGEAVDAFKPVVTGFDPTDFGDSDPATILSALERSPTLTEIERISPFRFEAPLAPSMAAEAEGRTLSFDALVEFTRERISNRQNTLVEGVGGIMVPLTRDKTVLDWLVAAGTPAILVTGTYLGAISHTLTALEAMAGRGVSPVGIIVSESVGGVDLAATVDALAAFAAARLLTLPRLPDIQPWRAAPDLLSLIQ